jgi:hypothetical protein
VNARDDCERYQDLLAGDAAMDAPERERLERHADSCAECAAVRRLHVKLDAALSSATEADVPDQLVNGMWPRVRAAQDAARATSPTRAAATGRWRWFAGLGGSRPAWGVPVMAAAILALLLVTGWLARESARLRAHERVLLERLEQVERSASTSSRLAAARPSTGIVPAWGAPVDELTAARARELLARLPAETLLLDAHDAQRVLDQMFPMRSFARRSLPIGVDLNDGLQAGEALTVVDRVLADRPDLARWQVGSLRRLVGL